MEWLDRMNDALGYLEANLAGTADMEHAARLACCSVYHFGRMFSYIAGVPLSEYLRRRRMTGRVRPSERRQGTGCGATVWL